MGWIFFPHLLAITVIKLLNLEVLWLRKYFCSIKRTLCIKDFQVSIYTLMILILMRTWCSAPPGEKALVSALNWLQAFLFTDILIIYENKNKTALLACQMEIFLRGEWQETGCSQTGKSHIIIQDLFGWFLKSRKGLMLGMLPFFSYIGWLESTLIIWLKHSR